MGCGGSKHDVATGNTTGRRALRKKPSDASYYASAASTDTSGNLQVPPPPADVKDITVSSTNGAVDAGEGKLLSHSPDRYFSSRKDDEAADAAAAGGEYFSPRYVPDGDQAIAKELTDLAAKGAAGSTTAAAATAAAEDGGQALGGATLKEDEGMLNGELPAGDLKEPILVEETKFEVTG